MKFEKLINGGGVKISCGSWSVRITKKNKRLPPFVLNLRVRPPATLISKSQRLQNAAAWLAIDLSKFCHITPALRQLHWLPVVKRIQFKILLLTFKSIHELSPPYISELINIKPKSSYSRSNNNTVLQYPQQKILATLGARSFASAAPSLWNKLPAAIRNAASLNEFKNMIKTFLFNEIL